MPKQNPERIDDENPEWTDETFAKAVPFTALPSELQAVLSSPKRVIVPKEETAETKQPAA